jgi:hypothetical protein
MLSALGLSLGQLADRRILRVLGKARSSRSPCSWCWALGWWGLDTAFIASGLRDDLASGAQTLRVLIAVIVLIGVWLLFRLVAIAVVQFFADEVVAAVEARHYPAFAATARPLGWRAEAAGAARAGAVGAVEPGRAAGGRGAAGHRPWPGAGVLSGQCRAAGPGTDRDGPAAPPRRRGNASRRAARGSGCCCGTVAGLLAVPFINLVAPVIGAATATHLVLRRQVLGGVSDAP